jgi:hypothetical protein
MYVSGIHSSYFISQNPYYDMYDNNFYKVASLNASGSTINSSLSATAINSTLLSLDNYTGFNSLVLSHPYGMQFAITNSYPALITTNSNILMTMDGYLGVDVNADACEPLYKKDIDEMTYFYTKGKQRI